MNYAVVRINIDATLQYVNVDGNIGNQSTECFEQLQKPRARLGTPIASSLSTM